MRSTARDAAAVLCADGWRLSVKVRSPPRPRAVAVAGHAMMCDRRTLDVGGDGLVSHLVARSVAVVWPDLRGHGESGPLAAAGGRWSYDDLVEQDTPALLAFARARFPGLPVAVVGHSLFGHVALAHAGRHPDAPVDGLVLLGANVWGARWEPDPLLLAAKRASLEAMGAITRLVGYFPTRRLRLGSCDEAAPYVEQLVGFLRAGWRARDGFSYADGARGVRKRLLAITAANDRLLCSPPVGRRFADEVAHAEHFVAGRASGLGIDPGHMGLVLDRRCRPAWERAAAFILGLAR